MPLSLRERIHWAYLTVRRDMRTYTPHPRPVTAERVRASLRPQIQRPVFVVGAPRSGTTFLGRCLAALPSLSYHFEPAAIQRAVQHVYRGTWTEGEAAGFYRFVYRWLLRLHLDGDVTLAEKTPRHAFLLPFLRRTFPDLRVIHIIRDGRDAALSHSKKPWLSERAAGSGTVGVGGNRWGPVPRFWVEPGRRTRFRETSDYHRCIWAWRRHVESALAAGRQLPGGQYHELRYESLVQDPRAEADRLLDFLSIHEDPARRALHEVAAQAHADSVGGWQIELTPEQRATARREAGSTLDRLGYLDE